MVTATTPPPAPHAPVKRILVVDDEEYVIRSCRRVLARAGWEVVSAQDVTEASRILTTQDLSVVLCDINLPGASGTELLRVIRSYNLDIPVILMTGRPSLDTAIEAVRLGAVEYLTKPIDNADLIERVEHAFKLCRFAQLKREAMAACQVGASPSDTLSLGICFDRALQGLYMLYQPIVDLRKRRVVAYEALVRSSDTDLPTPALLIDAAERLGRHDDLGRRVREAVATSMPDLPSGMDCFVNLHVTDLLDEALYDTSPLTPYASRIVLEVTERGSIEEVENPKRVVARLRQAGYRIAVDDLGSGYAGLTSFTSLEPEVIKLDMGLIRGINADQLKRRLVDSMVDLCRSLNVRVVAEGIETVEELGAVMAAGCDLGQGYVLGRPSHGFAHVAWPAT